MRRPTSTPGATGHVRNAGRRRVLGLSLIALAIVAGPAIAQHSVFEYRGELSDPSSPEDTWFKEVELVDVNDDGWLDIVLPQKQPCPEPCVPEAFDNIDHLYLNQPGLILALDTPSTAFTFRPPAITFPPIDTTRNYDVELGDLDLDGHVDIVRPDRFGELKVMWGQSDGTFLQYTDVLQPAFGGNPNDECTSPNVEDGNYDDVDLADLDNDGDLDFAVAQYDTCGRSFLVENLSADGQPRAFQIRGVSPDELPAKLTHSVLFGKIDNNDSYDLAMANSFIAADPPNPAINPEIHFGTSQPFDFASPPLELLEPGPSSFRPTTVTDLVDLDGDGRTDVYLAQLQTGQRHGVYFHSGNDADPFPTFTPAPAVAFSLGLYDARYGDLDLDGNQEIIGVTINVEEDGDRFPTEIHASTVLPNRQIVDVAPDFLPSVLEGGIALDLGDLDNDGDQDMVLAGISSDMSMVYSGAHVYENRIFTELEDVTLGSGTVIAIKTLTAVGNVTVPAFTNVTLEAGETVIVGGLDANTGADLTLEAGETVIAGGLVAASGADVTLEAGDTIRLEDGFTAAAGSELVARIF